MMSQNEKKYRKTFATFLASMLVGQSYRFQELIAAFMLAAPVLFVGSAIGVGYVLLLKETKMEKKPEQSRHPWTQCREFLASISDHDTHSKGGYASQHILGRHAVAVPNCPRCFSEKERA
jgi:hypothetical protein